MDALAFGFASSKPQGVNPWYGENILFEIIPLTKQDNLESELRFIRDRQLTITRNMFKNANIPYVEHTLPVGVEAFLGGDSYKYGIPTSMPLHHIASVKQDNSYLYMAPMGWSSISSVFEDDAVRNSYLADEDASVYPKVVYLSTGRERYFSAQSGYIYAQERKKRNEAKRNASK